MKNLIFKSAFLLALCLLGVGVAPLSASATDDYSAVSILFDNGDNNRVRDNGLFEPRLAPTI